MAWQYNSDLGNITDPAVPRGQTGMDERCYLYYGGELIAESVRTLYGPLLAESANMLALLRRYVADDPCAPNDPRHKEACAIIERIVEEDDGRRFA
jgi:hypothetical protein